MTRIEKIQEQANQINRLRATKDYKDICFVIVERKLSLNARKTTFGFRALIDENINNEWIKEKGGTFSRMVQTA